MAKHFSEWEAEMGVLSLDRASTTRDADEYSPAVAVDVIEAMPVLRMAPDAEPAPALPFNKRSGTGGGIVANVPPVPMPDRPIPSTGAAPDTARTRTTTPAGELKMAPEGETATGGGIPIPARITALWDRPSVRYATFAGAGLLLLFLLTRERKGKGGDWWKGDA